MTQKCIVCGNDKFKSIIKIDNAPIYVWGLLHKNDLKNDKKISLELISCKKCKMSQLKRKSFVEPTFYNDYRMAVSYSKQAQDYQNKLAKNFVSFFNLKDKNAFEIGCGEGMFAAFLNENNLKTIGIEPSKAFYDLSKKRIKVLNQYLNSKTSLKKKYYDAFVSRQVFEHLNNPNQILGYAKLYLKSNGVGLIEVPSFLTAMKDKRYYDIFRDHAAYYTKYTLQYLLTKNNFEVIKIFHTANGEYLTAYFKNNDYCLDESKSFSTDYIKYKRGVSRFFSLNKNKKIVIWGAGGKGTAMLSMCNISSKDILFVIDSDHFKHGKYTVGSHILVKNPKDVNFNEVDIIIISAVMYKKEIINDLMNKYHYRNKIAIIAPKLRFIK